MQCGLMMGPHSLSTMSGEYLLVRVWYNGSDGGGWYWIRIAVWIEAGFDGFGCWQ